MYHFNSTFGWPGVRHVDSALELPTDLFTNFIYHAHCRAISIAANKDTSAGLVRIEIHDYRGEERGKGVLAVINELIALMQLDEDGIC